MSRTTHVEPARAQRAQVSRRTLLKTGAHAAWVIPAVQVVAAAPAFATVTSGSHATLTTTIADAYWGDANTHAGEGNYIIVDLTVTNTGTAPTNNLTITFTFSANLTDIHQQGADQAPKGTVPKGWVYSGASSSTTPPTIVYVAEVQLAAGQSITSTFILQDTEFNKVDRPAATVNVSTTTTGGTPGAGTYSVQAVPIKK